jgi:hypothetical protein
MRGRISAVTIAFISILLAFTFQNCQQSGSEFQEEAQSRQIEGFSVDFMKAVSDLKVDEKRLICDSPQQYQCTLRRYSNKLEDQTYSSEYCLDSEKSFCVPLSNIDYNSSQSQQPDYAKAFCVNVWVLNNSGIEVRFDSHSIGEALVSSRAECLKLMNLE